MTGMVPRTQLDKTDIITDDKDDDEELDYLLKQPLNKRPKKYGPTINMAHDSCDENLSEEQDKVDELEFGEGVSN